jgi:hypothetical protein
MADADRGRGVLTPADRRFLGGDVALGSEQSRYDARYRIRQRTRNALLDFPILFEHLAARDREQVFDAEHEELADAVADAVAFCYLGATSLDVDPEQVIAAGVRRAEQRLRGPDCPPLDVDVEVAAADEGRLAHIGDCIADGRVHELTERDLRTFARTLGEREDADLDSLVGSDGE